jgi:hypothetical protein
MGGIRRRAGLVTMLLLVAAALAGCGVVRPYQGPPMYGNPRGEHGA